MTDIPTWGWFVFVAFLIASGWFLGWALCRAAGRAEEDIEWIEKHADVPTRSLTQWDLGYAFCERQVRKALEGEPRSELWGEHGLLEATMRCVRACQGMEAQKASDDSLLRRCLDALNAEAMAAERFKTPSQECPAWFRIRAELRERLSSPNAKAGNKCQHVDDNQSYEEWLSELAETCQADCRPCAGCQQGGVCDGPSKIS